MHSFKFHDGTLHCEGVSLTALAEEHGTPLYVYSSETFLDHFGKLQRAFGDVLGLICFSVKANSNLSVLRLLHEAGSGFDIVSGGELERIKALGIPGEKVVFAGVGKSPEAIEAALAYGVRTLNVESEPELVCVDAIASRLGVRAPVALRLNPNVPSKTHPYITTGKKENKFGVDLDTAERLVASLKERFPACDLVGIHVHVGSQITEVEPFLEGIRRVRPFLAKARKVCPELALFDIGGGFGIWYQDQRALTADVLARDLVPALKETGLQVVMEPGRFIAGNAGVLLTRVRYVKRNARKRFVIVDADMNDLMRPSYYKAYHRIWPTGRDPHEMDVSAGLQPCDIVGPICESGGFLGLDRPFPEVGPGDLVTVFSTGAYGFSMASNYNTRPRAAEVLVAGDRAKLVRRRETIDDLLRLEREAL